MRTGLKTLYHKIRNGIDYPDQLLSDLYPKEIPLSGLSWWKIYLKIYSLKNYLKSLEKIPRLNEIRSVPNSVALKVWKNLLPFNPNNIGNWSTPKLFDIHGTQKAENQLINLLIGLYGSSPTEWEGHVTSGGSESNLYAMWLGRNLLTKNCLIKNICVLQNDLTHYSVPKSANILNLDIFQVEINNKTWTFDIPSFEKKVLNLIKKKYRCFIIPLTYGYAQTGTNDSYQKINFLMQKLKKKYSISYYIFIDAALNGLVLPFSKNNFYPLRKKNLDSFSVDFHKFGKVPFSCGVILYRKHLRENIQLKVPFLSDYDSTLSGSRSGISPAAALMVLLSLGKKGFIKNTQESIKLKENFIEIVKKEFPNIEIIDDKDGVTIGLITDKPLPKKFLDWSGVFAKSMLYHLNNKNRKCFIYKATFISNK